MPKYSGKYLDYQNKNPVIIGDVHGQLKALKELLEGTTKNTIVILNGDYIDKQTDDNILNTIEYIYNYKKQNPDKLYLTIGNHEYKAYNVLKSNQPHPWKYPYAFTTINLLNKSNNSDYKQMFFELYENSYPYICLHSNRENLIYVNHSPCLSKYIGKDDKVSIGKQLCTFNKNLNTYILNNSTYRVVWGHMSVDKPFEKNNKVFIDTGADVGHLLTAYVPQFDHFISVPCEPSPYPGSSLIDHKLYA